MNTAFDRFQEIVAAKSTFVITSHINPDGDAIGSETALAQFLQNLGKTVSVINQSPTPDNLLFLSASIFPVLLYEPSLHSALIRAAECVIVVDTNAPNRFAALAGDIAAGAGVTVCIDHHLEPEPFADLYVTDAEAPATSELLYELFMSIDGAAITSPVAKALYAGIMTDTGSFRFPKTDADTHIITADLLRRGADPAEIYQAVYDTGPVNKLQLLGRALDSIRSIEGGAVAWMVIRQNDFSETNTVAADTDNFINYTLSIGGVKIGLLFTELDGVVKVSFRSKGEIWINRLAKEFGGNGHKHAAGARTTGRSLDELIGQVTERARTYIQ
jgi:bifunctional oligoribonuclease and PAP phosphatase NrnA